ncbi:GATA-binding factor C-like [Panicum virgatum]|uniref:GATA-type domain-containing protein n=1 Tax=Panicum virgatum TaxID=38727 RepID=A0A8T0Q5K1_PANVG|nr:GATA-binding factor C-like [Panicum virgatum]KAG2568408.1 hypothetical protein PVAP13_7NG288300 [Panicum virgatum]
MATAPGLGPRTGRSAATMATDDLAGGGREGEREGALGYILSLPAAVLPLPVAVSCLDATVPRRRAAAPPPRPAVLLWTFELPIPAPEEPKSLPPTASAATNPTEEARPPDPHTPAPAMERPAKRARRCLQCGATETPQWRSGPMGSGTLCNACGVQLKAAGALREQVHRPPPVTVRTVAEPPPESSVSDSSPDCPIWEPGRLHCGSSSPPQWWEGPMGRSTLCNSCGARYRQGRLLPEYRPLASPTFEPSEHANRHSQVLQLHRQWKGHQKNQQRLPTEEPQPVYHPTGAPPCSGGGGLASSVGFVAGSARAHRRAGGAPRPAREGAAGRSRSRSRGGGGGPEVDEWWRDGAQLAGSGSGSRERREEGNEKKVGSIFGSPNKEPSN